MSLDWELIIFVLLLIDSVGAVLMSWFGQNWWLYTIGRFSEYFPPAKGWSAVYLILVLFLGYLMGII